MESFLAALGKIAQVDTGADYRHLMAQDIFSSTEPVAAVVAPGSSEVVAAIVQLALQYDVALAVRGGGMSYSGGYLSANPASTVLIDMRTMDRVLAIDTQNMFVVVEAGCTWEALHATLDPIGLRTAFWGPLSGRVATVGGAISQNAIFWGSGSDGSAVDSVLGIECVLADGSVVRTGSFGVTDATPFFRHFGPDLTGLFTADAGAMGIKTQIVLRLVAKARRSASLSFVVPSITALCALLSETARRGLVTQQMGLDDGLKTARMASEGLSGDLGHFFRVLGSGSTWWSGLRNAANMAMAGRSLLDGMPYSAHLFLEARSSSAIAAATREARSIALSLDAKEVPASVGHVMLATPFPPVNGIVGPKGERWVPVHCVVPHSVAANAYAVIERIIADQRPAMESFGICHSYLFTTIGANGFVIEPMFFWPDGLGELHRNVLPKQRLARFVERVDAPDARALVSSIRQSIVAQVDALGAVHMQLGQFYPYASRLNPATRKLVQALRNVVDPSGRINRQSLSG